MSKTIDELAMENAKKYMSKHTALESFLAGAQAQSLLSEEKHPEEVELWMNRAIDAANKAETRHYLWVRAEEEIQSLTEKLEVAMNELNTEELKLELMANQGPGGLYNEGASSILKRWIEDNDNALSKLKKESGDEPR